MTIAQTIANAREHLDAQNYHGFKAILTAGIRSSKSSQSANAYRSALKIGGFSIHPGDNWHNPTVEDVYLTPQSHY